MPDCPRCIDATPLAKTLSYGDATPFSLLPLGLVQIVERNRDFKNVRHQTWRQVVLGTHAHWVDENHVVVPIELVLYVVDHKSQETIAPFRVGCHTRCLLLTRLFDADEPTDYFVGQHSESGAIYWALHQIE